MGRITRALRHELGYRVLTALLATARAIPLPVARAGGRALGTAAARLSRRQRDRVLAQLEACFPAESREWREGVARRCARHLGTLFAEVAWLWGAPAATILERTRWNGLEHLAGSRERENGAILVTAHCGNWEWMNLAITGTGVPMTVAAREVYDPRIDEIVRRLRGRFGGETVLRGEDAGKKLVRAARGGRVVGLLIDQDIDTPGVFVEFFGRPAWTPSGAATLALRTRRPIVTGFAQRLDDGTIAVRFDAPLHPVASGDLERDAATLTAELTARIEAQIRRVPEQWVWMHPRWRHQPEAGQPVWRHPAAAAAPLSE